MDEISLISVKFWMNFLDGSSILDEKWMKFEWKFIENHSFRESIEIVTLPKILY